jgi:hypothetical protein
MKIDKELVGKTVYLTPSGNLYYRSRKNEIITAIVKKVARVNITLHFISGSWEHDEVLKYADQCSQNYLSAGDNSGYNLFFSKEEIEEKEYSEKLASKIANKYHYASDYQNVPLSILINIATLLGIDIKEL